MTDNIFSLTPDTKPSQKKGKYVNGAEESVDEEDEEEDEQLVLAHQESDFTTRFSPEESEYYKDSFVIGDQPPEGIKILYIQMQYCDGETLEEFLLNGEAK